MKKNTLDFGQQMQLVKWIKRADRDGRLTGLTVHDAADLATKEMEFPITLSNIRTILPHADLKWKAITKRSGQVNVRRLEELETRIKAIEVHLAVIAGGEQ